MNAANATLSKILFNIIIPHLDIFIGLCPCGFPTETLYALLASPMHAKCQESSYDSLQGVVL
jgi:hypothetical protein